MSAIEFQDCFAVVYNFFTWMTTEKWQIVPGFSFSFAELFFACVFTCLATYAINEYLDVDILGWWPF